MCCYIIRLTPFQPVINLLRELRKDPQVLAIKQTLCRSGPDSDIVQVLAEAGSQRQGSNRRHQTRARFDEDPNITVANILQEAWGCRGVYGIVGYKTHPKMILIVRREKIIGCYAMPIWEQVTTTQAMRGCAADYGLMTTHPDICEDVHRMFQELTAWARWRS